MAGLTARARLRTETRSLCATLEHVLDRLETGRAGDAQIALRAAIEKAKKIRQEIWRHGNDLV